MTKKCDYAKCIHTLNELKKNYPNRTLGQHISTSIADYGDGWGISDKEFLFALEKYVTELEFNLEEETSIEKIIADGIGDRLFQLDEEEEDYG